MPHEPSEIQVGTAFIGKSTVCRNKKGREGRYSWIKTSVRYHTHTHTHTHNFSEDSFVSSLKRTSCLFFSSSPSCPHKFKFIFYNPFLYFIIKTHVFYIFYAHNLETISFMFGVKYSLFRLHTHTHTHTHR